MKESVLEIIAEEPKYRQDQLYKAFFNPAIKNYEEISTFPLELRKKLTQHPWLSVKEKIISKSKIDGTEKALLELADGLCIETVLMARASKKDKNDEETDKLRRTICISSQVGCAMGCAFCATGAQGFGRNLSTEEIIDQYRFWKNHLAAPSSHKATKGGETVGNIVIMGQGEPLANYDTIKSAINILLKNTDIAPSKITISTVGLPEPMEKILTDKDFPPVRIAISLHSAIETTRKKIMPSSQEGFLDFLVKWSEKYHKALGSRSHFISLEYVMLKNINDDEKHQKALISLGRKLGRVKINLIPLNEAAGGLKGSSFEVIKKWQDAMMKAGLTCTIRHSQGADIAAACGQLTST